MKKRIRIMHLLQSSRFSGAENVVCQIFKMFEKNDEIEMIYCSKDGKIREALSERNIPFLALTEFSTSQVRKAIKQFSPDLIHAHDMKASYIAALAAPHVQLISHIHNNSFESRGLSIKSVAYLFAAIHAKHIFWVSDAAYKGYCFHELLEKKSSVLYNIIDLTELNRKLNLEKTEYHYDLIFLGRITEVKNPLMLIDVLSDLKTHIPNVKMAIVGTGNMEKEVRQCVIQKGLEHNVDFLGFIKNPYKLLHDTKVLIMTSLWEGTPMAALEALALGVPVVSTPTDGLVAIIKNDYNGYLFEKTSELSNCIYNILCNPLKHRELSNNAKKWSQEYNNVYKYKVELIKQYKKDIH